MTWIKRVQKVKTKIVPFDKCNRWNKKRRQEGKTEKDMFFLFFVCGQNQCERYTSHTFLQKTTQRFMWKMLSVFVSTKHSELHQIHQFMTRNSWFQIHPKTKLKGKPWSKHRVFSHSVRHIASQKLLKQSKLSKNRHQHHVMIWFHIWKKRLRARFRRARKPHFFQYVCATIFKLIMQLLYTTFQNHMSGNVSA